MMSIPEVSTLKATTDHSSNGGALAGDGADLVSRLTQNFFRVFKQEQNALERAYEHLRLHVNEVEKACRVLSHRGRCGPRVILSGVGKAGMIAQKVSATLNSTGTAATFIHPVEGLHGDLGFVQPG